MPAAVQVGGCRLGVHGWAHILLCASFRALRDQRWQGDGDAAPMTESCGEKGGARSRPLTLAMPASSRLLHWMAGSEVGAEVKLCLADKNGAAPKLPTRRRRGHIEIGRVFFFFPIERRAELRWSR